MKFVFLAGGFAGFVIVGTAGFWAGHQPDRVLFDAAVGCLAGALLFRWFWTVLVRGLHQVLVARQAAANAAAAAAAAAAKNK